MDNVKNMLLMAETVSKEKGISKDEVVSFIEQGIEVALKKGFPEGSLVQVEIDRTSGDLNAWRLFKLVDQIENVEAEMLHNEVEDEEVSDGYVWEKINTNLNRQQFNITRQVALQKLNNQTRNQHIENLLTKDIKIYSGIVRQIRKDHLLIDHVGVDIRMPRSEWVGGERYTPGERIRFTVVERDGRMVASRGANEFLIELFKEEIPRVADKEINIVYCARIPGFRSKVVVKTKNSKIDPVRFCIGSKGVHVKNIQHELKNEHIDILQYEYDVAQMVIRAVSPVIVNRIILDEEEKTMDLCVDEDSIGMLLGRGGKNIELVSELVGWKINAYTEEQWDRRNEIEAEVVRAIFTNALNCDETVADYLNECGITTLEEVAYVPVEDMEADELDEESLGVLKVNAINSLKDESVMETVKNMTELVRLGLLSVEAEVLLKSQVKSVSELADLATYELLELLPHLEEEAAGKIIMVARNRVQD